MLNSKVCFDMNFQDPGLELSFKTIIDMENENT